MDNTYFVKLEGEFWFNGHHPEFRGWKRSRDHRDDPEFLRPVKVPRLGPSTEILNPWIEGAENEGVCEPMDLIQDVAEAPLLNAFLDASHILGQIPPENSLAECLDQIATNLLGLGQHVDLDDVVRLLKSFNLRYNSKGKEMCNHNECANPFIISHLMQFLNFIKDQNYSFPVEIFKVECFFFLALLARNASARNIMANFDYVSLVTQQIRTTNNVELFEKVLFFFGNSIPSLVDAQQLRHKVVEEGFVPTILNTMKENFSRSSFLQVGFFALGNLMFTGDYESLFVEHKGIEVAFEALDYHKADAILVTDALFFLKNITCSTNGAKLVVSHPKFWTIMGFLKQFPDEPQLLRLVVQMIFDISFCPPECFGEIAEFAFPFLFDYLEQTRCERLTKESLKTLVRFYCNSSSAIKVRLLQSGLISRLKQPFDRCKTNSLTKLFLQQISKSIFTYEKHPSSCTMTLMEIASRNVKCTVPQNSQMNSKLCLDLKEYLDKGEQCDGCGNHYFEYFFEKVFFEKHEHFSKSLPTIKHFCSQKCIESHMNYQS